MKLFLSLLVFLTSSFALAEKSDIYEPIEIPKFETIESVDLERLTKRVRPIDGEYLKIMPHPNLTRGTYMKKMMSKNPLVHLETLYTILATCDDIEASGIAVGEPAFERKTKYIGVCDEIELVRSVLEQK